MSGLPVVFGWGKKGKFIGYVGIDKCPNCKNYVHFSIYEYSNRVNIYFVPIVKFNKKNYLVCPICEAAYELTDNLKEYYFSEMFSAMNSEDTQEIFSSSLEIITENFGDVLNREDINMDEKVQILIDMCIKKLNSKFKNEKYVDKVARMAFSYLLDQDKAE